jgi:membrane-bound serine protease (ClpP class)
MRGQLILVAGCALMLWGVAAMPRLAGQPSRPVVYAISIEGTIDLGLAPFLARTIREAKEAGAAAVLLDINTFGGRVDAAVAMRDTLLNSPVRTIAFVNQRAISAGALIALACDTLIMTPGGTIGAAAPVTGGGAGQTQPADEKSVSYVRKEFRATAETRKRPPEIAEAMVDADVEIAGLIAKGKLLTLTTSEALKYKVAELTADTVEGALEAAGVPGAEVRRASQSWAETLVRFLTHPVVSSLLMTIGLLGLLVEIRTPGFAAPGTIGLLALGLFFWGHWIVQLAGWEELLLVSIGAALIALEVFVIPGFSVAGIGGIVVVVAGLGMTLGGAGATLSVVIEIGRATGRE